MASFKRRTPEYLKIQLGLKCNYRCNYCLQRSSVGGEEKTELEDVETFLETLKRELSGEPRQIEFWGGEPLLYAAKLRRLVPALRLQFPRSVFYLATNGSLIDREWIDFFEHNDVTVAISHDGPAQALRGPDPLEKSGVLDAWTDLFARRPRRTALNFLLTPQSHDIGAIERWFIRRMPGSSVRPNVEGVVRVFSSDDAQRFAFDDVTGPSLMRSLRARMMSPGRASFYLELLASAYSKQLRGEAGPPGLLAFDERSEACLTVDLKGSVLANHNFAGEWNRLGSLKDLENLRPSPFLPAGGLLSCGTCAVSRTCLTRGFRAGDSLNDVNCRNAFYFHSGVLAVARERLQEAGTERILS